MFNRISKFKYLFKIIIFFPLIFYFGKRSYIAFDEGFYALQARWILEKVTGQFLFGGMNMF